MCVCVWARTHVARTPQTKHTTTPPQIKTNATHARTRDQATTATIDQLLDDIHKEAEKTTDGENEDGGDDEQKK